MKCPKCSAKMESDFLYHDRWDDKGGYLYVCYNDDWFIFVPEDTFDERAKWTGSKIFVLDLKEMGK